MRASGETDFPCITGERVGMGRSYVKLDGKLDYDAWCDGIRLGRCYVTDGRSHLMDFAVNGLPLGERGSELRLLSAGRVVATAKVAAYLPEEAQQSSPDRRGLRSWNLERARITGTRNVNVELVVNGWAMILLALAAPLTAVA